MLALSAVPLLPLAGQVLLPGLPQAWRFAAPVHRLLIRDLLTRPAAQRWLALPRIAPGWEDENDPPLLPIVSAARLVLAHELADGSFHVLVVGEGRWHLDEQPSGRPYRQGQLVRMPEAPLEGAAQRRVAAAVERLLRGRAAIDDEVACLLDLAQHPPELVLDRLAALTLVDPDLRQRYLESQRLCERLCLLEGVVATGDGGRAHSSSN